MTVCDLVACGPHGPSARLVLELAVVHELADRRAGHRRDLDEVEVGLLGQPQRVADGDDADLLAVGTDEPHLGDADPVVDPGLSADGASSIWLVKDPGHEKGFRARSSRKPQHPVETS